MTETDPPDHAAGEALPDPELTAAILSAALHHDDVLLTKIATAVVAGGTDREHVLQACYAAQDEIQKASGDEDDPAEDHLLDLMDRLVGWCPPGAAI
ncbi:hypothetical protein VSH64_34030 [Amycolatopsis rhabdoformis]|uniref:Uncharacterized protein n=1 Tax=Amycolatopsis rhabdoformis TaxID=1448059 RepID=A0ABZ1I0E0_9PSEU|nr:hypothetical protein [Amycolatopsis rhabdoformis]WSE27839.1 hypothetical protein VSH64_34030 [Amycolatopsis rhabdoformis]